MNPTTAILFALLAAYVQAHPKDVSASEAVKQKARNQCIKETKVTPEQTEILYKYKDVPKDDAENCFMECIYRETGGIDADGKYSLEGFIKLVDMKYKGDENIGARKIASDCASKATPKEGEKCSVGRSIRECFASAAKKYDYFTI